MKKHLFLPLLIFFVMSTVKLQAVEVFRAGNYPQGNFTSNDLSAIATSYDPAFLKAPNTIDHAQSGVAYGYVTRLHTNGVSLYADIEVSPELAEQIKNKKFLSRSVEIFRDLEGKGKYLKAVSWLGAKIPQVKGLADVDFSQFSASAAETIEFSLTNEELAAKFSALEAELAEKDSRNAITEAERDAALEELAKAEMNRVRINLETYVNEQIAFGRLTPANKDIALQLLEALESVPMFANQSKSPVELLKDFIANQPMVQFAAPGNLTAQPVAPKSDYDVVKASHELTQLHI